MTESEILALFGSPVNCLRSARDLMREWAKFAGVIDGATDEDELMLANMRGSMLRTADRIDRALERIEVTP